MKKTFEKQVNIFTIQLKSLLGTLLYYSWMILLAGFLVRRDFGSLKGWQKHEDLHMGKDKLYNIILMWSTYLLWSQPLSANSSCLKGICQIIWKRWGQSVKTSGWQSDLNLWRFSFFVFSLKKNLYTN